MPEKVIGSIDLKVGFGEEIDQCGLKSYIVEYLNAYNIPYSTDYSIGQMITLLTDKINNVNPYADCGIVSEPQRFFGNYEEAVIVRDVEGSCTIPGAIDVIEQRVVFTAGDIVINGDDNHYWMAMVDKPESEPTNAGHLAGEWCDITDMCEKFDLLFPFTIEYDSSGVPHLIEGKSIIVRVDELEACCEDIKDRVDAIENTLSLKEPIITILDGNDIILEGESWTDAGATADDNGVDVTSSIVVNGSVSTSLPGTYLIEYTITTANGFDRAVRIVTVLENTGLPTITILEGDDVIQEGDSWTDAGVVAKDRDGNIITDVTVTGEVDTSTPGVYVIRYCVTSFNDTVCEERLVNVVREILVPPTITLIPGNDDINIGDEWIDAGATADDNGTDVTSSIVVNGDVDTNTNGTYIVTYTITTDNGTASVIRTIYVGLATASPTLELNEGVDVIINIGDEWIDAGATATSSDGTDISSSIVTSYADDVDTSTPGIYIVTYCVTSGGITVCRDRAVSVAIGGCLEEVIFNGDNPVTTPIGYDYIDAGATAIDCEGNPVEFTVDTSNVDTTTLGTYTVTFTTANGTRYTRLVEVVPCPQTITIDGDDSITAPQGLDYIDAGATAVDCMGNPIDVTIDTSDVDTTTLGTYTVTFTTPDGTTVTREVEIVPCPQSIELIGDASVTTSKGADYIDAGANAVDCEGNPIDVTIDTSDVDTTTLGTYTVTLSTPDGTTITREVTVVCETTITLNGRNPTRVEIYSAYVDAGATAVDCEGNPITLETDLSEVDTSTTRGFNVTYTAPDGTTLVRQVIVYVRIALTYTSYYMGDDGLCYYAEDVGFNADDGVWEINCVGVDTAIVNYSSVPVTISTSNYGTATIAVNARWIIYGVVNVYEPYSLSI